MIPIQAITCLIHLVVGLAATLLFLKAYFVPAFVASLTVTQGWCAFSEILRAYHRGAGKLSAYQIMAILAIVYAVALTTFLGPESEVIPQLTAGIAATWRLEVFLLLQALRVFVFLLFGKSMVTGAQISFHLHHDRI